MNEICIPFRHNSKEIISNVKSSFENELIVQRWIDCAEDALSCCRNVLHQWNDEGILIEKFRNALISNTTTGM